MINLPIKRFKLKENKVIINNLIVEYEDISEDNREILESLISKGAYGSALLTLNSFYNVKKINEAECSHSEYLSYLKECNNLMKECVVETDKAHDFRPLINLNGFEIMESADHIARGKGDKLLVEDFRKDYESLSDYELDDYADKLQQELKSIYNDDEVNVLRFEILDLLNKKERANNRASGNGLRYNKKLKELIKKAEDQLNEAEGTQCSDIASRKDQSVGRLQKPKKKRKRKFIKEGTNTSSVFTSFRPSGQSDGLLGRLWFNIGDKVETIDLFYTDGEYSLVYGTFVPDYIKEFVTNYGGYPKFVEDAVSYFKNYNKSKIDECCFNVPRNHGFKGFMMDESGLYTRGNYVLIKEGKTIKAVNKKSLENK